MRRRACSRNARILAQFATPHGPQRAEVAKLLRCDLGALRQQPAGFRSLAINATRE